MLSVIFDNLGLIATGAAGAAGGVVAIKGVPASWAWLKAWLAKGKVDLVALKGGVVALEQRVAKLEGKAAPAAPVADAAASALVPPAPAPQTQPAA